MARTYRGEDPMQLAMFDIAKGERFREDADEWVRRNPEAWAFIRSEAVRRTYQGKCFGIGELVEQVRWHMRASGADGFKCNNNIRAPLARRLIEEYPPCKPYIKTRDSAVDLA